MIPLAMVPAWYFFMPAQVNRYLAELVLAASGHMNSLFLFLEVFLQKISAFISSPLLSVGAAAVFSLLMLEWLLGRGKVRM